MSFHNISVILPILESPQLGNLELVISELYKNSNLLSSSDREHVCGRLNNLLKSYHPYNNFFAVKLIHVLLFDPQVLSLHGSQFFISLIKLISNINSFNDNSKLVPIVLKSSLECVQHLLAQTRGKPELTRDIVTPNLPSLIGAVVKLIDIDPLMSVQLLLQLIQSNTTTFRPFGAKFEKRLLSLLKNSSSMSQPLQRLVCDSFLLCQYILHQKNNNDSFNKFCHDLISQFKSVLEIYKLFIDVEDSGDLFDKLSHLPSLTETSILDPLNIDSNSPRSIFTINERLAILTEILISTFSINHSFKYPLGAVVLIQETLLSFNLNFVHLKLEFRFIDLKTTLLESILQVQQLGVHLLTHILPLMSNEILPHFNSLISSLEYSIPVGKLGIIDKQAIFRDEDIICDILANATSLISMVVHYTDYPMLTKLIEASFVLIEPRTPPVTEQQVQSKKNKKKLKSQTTLSDLISHGGLFIKEVPIRTKRVLNNFYEKLIVNVNLPLTKKTQIVRYVLKELLLNQKQSDLTLKSLLKLILMNPTLDSVNVLPFVTQILADDDEMLSLFINPRLPPLPQTVNIVEEVEEDEEEEEVEEMEVEEIVLKKRKLSEEVVLPVVEEVVVETKHEDKIFTKPTNEVKLQQDVIMTTPSEPVAVPVSVPVLLPVLPLEESDDESDIEIPDIEVSSDEE